MRSPITTKPILRGVKLHALALGTGDQICGVSKGVEGVEGVDVQLPLNCDIES